MSEGDSEVLITRQQGEETGRQSTPSETLLPAAEAPSPTSIADVPSTAHLATPFRPPGWKGCEAITKAGDVCMMPALAGRVTCWSHSPGLAAEAGRQAHRPGHRRGTQPRVNEGAAIAIMDDTPIDSPEAIAQMRTAVVHAVRRGEMAPDVGVALSRILEDQRKAIESIDVGRRLDALEADDDHDDSTDEDHS